MAKIAVLRDAEGKIIGVMRGNYTLLEGWVEEDDVGQTAEAITIPPVQKAINPEKLKAVLLRAGIISSAEESEAD